MVPPSPLITSSLRISQAIIGSINHGFTSSAVYQGGDLDKHTQDLGNTNAGSEIIVLFFKIKSSKNERPILHRQNYMN